MSTIISKPHTRKNIPIVVNLDNFTAEDIGRLDTELATRYPCWIRNQNLISVDTENFRIHKNTGKRTDVSLKVALEDGLKLKPHDVANIIGVYDETIALVDVSILPTREICLKFVISHLKYPNARIKKLHHFEYLIPLTDTPIVASVANLHITPEGNLMGVADNGQVIILNKDNTSDRDTMKLINFLVPQQMEPSCSKEEIWVKLVSVLLWYCANDADLEVYMNNLESAFIITPVIKTKIAGGHGNYPSDLSVAKSLFTKWEEDFPTLASFFHMLETRRLYRKTLHKTFSDLEFKFDKSNMHATFTETPHTK